ncbi:MAG: prepilin-type N-terminal cleavage/methylation domain-containing protein [Gemmatimonadota bacterium]
MTRRGFTLIEVLVALALGGMVLLMAHRIFGAAADAMHALGRSREALDREQNGARWLTLAFENLDVADSAGGFDGRPDHVRFQSWQLVPAGWFAHQGVELGAVGGSLIARAGTQRPITLADSVVGAEFDYLLEPGAHTSWVRTWISPLSAPLAVRLRVARRANGMAWTDTLLVLIGERG